WLAVATWIREPRLSTSNTGKSALSSWTAFSTAGAAASGSPQTRQASLESGRSDSNHGEGIWLMSERKGQDHQHGKAWALYEHAPELRLAFTSPMWYGRLLKKAHTNVIPIVTWAFGPPI